MHNMLLFIIFHVVGDFYLQSDEVAKNKDCLLYTSIDDYNKEFKQSFDTSSEGFQNYYKDLSQRMKRREIDPVSYTHLDVYKRQAVGKDGYLVVVKDMNMKENWSGTVALQSGEIGDDFAYYFTASEQTPSAVSVGVLVDTDNSILSAGGMIIQMLPDAEEKDIVKVEQIVANLRHMSTMIQEYESLEDILRDLFDDCLLYTSRCV